MNDCEKYSELISALIDGELNDEERAALEAHLAECPDCRRVSEAFSAISGETAAREDVPFDFCERTMYKIKLESERPSGLQRFIKGYGKYTGLAAVLAILLIGASTVPNLFDSKAPKLASDENNAAPRNVTIMSAAVSGGSADGAVDDIDAMPESADIGVNNDEGEADEPQNSERDFKKSTENGVENYLADNTAPLMLGSAPPSAEEFYSEHGYTEAFYCIAHLIDAPPAELYDCEVIHFDNEGEHYKVPQAVFTELEAEGLFDTIIFDDLSSDTAIVIADIAENEE